MPPGAPPPLPSDPYVAALSGLYAKAERKLDRLIAGAVGRGAKGTEQFFTNQRSQVKKILRDLRRQAQPLEAAATRSAYRGAVGTVDRVVDRSKAFSGVHTAAEEVMAANLAGRLRYAEEFVGRKADDVFRAAALEEVGVAIAAGIGPRQQAADLETRLRREGVTAFVDRGGRRWRLGVYAAMVTRTTTREASSVGMKNRMLEYGFDLVKISEHRHSCPICIPYQGKTFSLTGHDEHYPHLEVLPPFHPNCRHVLLPAPVTFEEIEKELGLAPPESFPTEEPDPLDEAIAGLREYADSGQMAREAPKDSIHDHVALSASRAHEEQMKGDLDSIDKVHSIPASMTVVPVQTRTMKGGVMGQYKLAYDPTTGSWEGESIAIHRGALNENDSSLVHEIGHWLDGHFFGRPIDDHRIAALKSRRYATETEPEFEDWLAAVKASPEIDNLMAGLMGDPFIRERSKYLTDVREIFARSYEQWISIRSGNANLREKQRKMVEHEKNYYWTDENFEPIAEAFDKLFSTLGLLK